MGLAHFLQVLVSWKDNSLIFRQRLHPSRQPGQSANASRQRRVIQGSTSRLEPCKLLKLGGRAAHHKAVTIVCVAFCRRGFPQRSVSLVIVEHRLISEAESIAIKTELRRCDAGACECDSGKNAEPPSRHRFAPAPEHHIKREPGQ